MDLIAGHTTLASASADGSVRLWDGDSGRAIATLSGHQDVVRCVRFTRDGRRLFSGGDDRSVREWDVATSAHLGTLLSHAEAVQSLDLSLDDKTLRTGNSGGTLKLWAAGSGQLLLSLQVADSPNPPAAAFLPDGTNLCVASEDGWLRSFHAESETAQVEGTK